MASSVPSNIVPAPQGVAATPRYQVQQSSIQTLCGTRPIIVSYGYSSAAWTQVSEALKVAKGDANIWDFSLSAQHINHTSSSGNEVIKVHVPEGNSTGSARGSIGARRQCKAGLINIIYHNYRMQQMGVNDFVPVIFNIDLKKMFDPSSIDKSSRTTCSELECLRQLCTDPTLPADFRAMAIRTVKFVQVKELIYTKPALGGGPRTKVTKFSLEETQAPWEVPGYDAHVVRVKAKFLAKNPEFAIPPNMPQFDWRQQLDLFLDPDMGILTQPVVGAAPVPMQQPIPVQQPVPLVPQQVVDPVGAK